MPIEFIGKVVYNVSAKGVIYMIYLDNAATTSLSKEVLDAMIPYLTDYYGNASSIYKIGRDSKKALEESRETVAEIIGCKAQELYFTASGSEADNWTVKGIAYTNRSKGNHIITTAIEHHAILHTCESLKKEGFKITYLPVDEFGMVSPSDLENAITDQTILISIIFANNEIGTIQPIKELAAIAKAHGIPFHTDAVQATGTLPIDVNDLGVDLLSMSAHKFHGPKGVGALYIRQGIRIGNLIDGGAQERNRRAGTENIAGIVGLAHALRIANAHLEEKTLRIMTLRDRLIQGIQEKIPYVRLNGHPTKRLPGNVNFSFRFIEGESMLLMLDLNDIAASSGSACTSGSLDPSHVLLAIGLPHEIAHGSLRLSIGDENTEEEIDRVLEVLPGIVEKLRNMSPLYDDFIKNSNE